MKRGSSWESVLDVWHQRYRTHGVATIIHCHPKASVAKDGRVFWEAKGPPDYMGAALIGSEWSPIVFEAKETKSKKLAFSMLMHHQAQYLEAYTMAGWITGVAAAVDGRYLWFPWRRNNDAWFEKTRGSFEHGIEIPEDGWISVVGEP